ncbi:hypothetical protein VTN02DRAFT_2844 [Thermoascus thermophilus]
MAGAALAYGNGQSEATTKTISTDILIIGAGPAGASLACFLASHGIHGIMVSSASTHADTPRAHITNMAALECLRDIGLEAECNRLATKGNNMTHTRWAHSMAGEEYARVYSWGNDPRRKGDYETASPCNPVDLPQTLLEPVLLRYATMNGFKCRFDTSFIEFVDDDKTGTVTTTLQDNVSGTRYKVRSRYLFGADGARSPVLKQLGLPLNAKPGQGLAINVLVKADMSHLMEHRAGNLHWLFQPDRAHPAFGWSCIARMVKPWYEWMFILFPDREASSDFNPTQEEYLQRVKELIGDESIPAEVLGVSKWYINEIVAEKYSKGNVFCLGDAVHRHPPMNGLGSNTCIQDAYNLAWKIAYVMKGLASPSLLETYSIERQPVGHGVISRANQAFRENRAVLEAFGFSSPDIETRKRILQELSAPSEAGRARRKALQAAIEQEEHEFHGLGQEMGQRYESSAIYTADEKTPYKAPEAVAKDPVLHYVPSTYPGCRLSHVWLNKAVPVEPVSTIDLAGKGSFTVLTGIGGEAWKEAAAQVGSLLGITVNAYSIGFRQDYEDVYFDWARVRGVDETGCILVRPDRFVAWRCAEVLGDATKCADKLATVMRSILGLSS